MKGLRWNEVLVQRVSPNWCDSSGRQTSLWVEEDGASMCVQSDKEHAYCMNNHNEVTIHSLEEDASVVKVSLHGE